MFLKVRCQSTKKYVKFQSGCSYQDFIAEVKSKFGFPDSAELLILDETDTEIEEDVFVELVEANPDLCLKIEDRLLDKSLSSMDNSSTSSLTDTMSPSSDNEPWSPPRQKSSTQHSGAPSKEALEKDAAKEMVENALKGKPGGQDILEEYKSEKSLSHRSRRQLVNLIVSEMTERHGRMPSRKQKENYALGIITAFPSLRDPFSQKGYEHFYDAEKGTGYLAWRLKTLSRKVFKRPVKEASEAHEQGPKRRRTSDTSAGEQLSGDACREALSFLGHSTDVASVFQKMKSTLEYRQDLVRDSEQTTDVFKIFPRFLDVKGLVNQDFALLFGEETASRMLERWDTVFKPKIIMEARHLTETPDLSRLMAAAEKNGENENYWDSDMASLLLLLHLLPPTAGRRRVKISSSEAEKKLVHFLKSSSSLEEHLRDDKNSQPYIIAVGQTKSQINTFYVAVDKKPIPCQSTSSLGAFDELFKAHFVFNTSYDPSLVQFYNFIQTTIYNIDVKSTDESPRLRDFLLVKYF
ncbi:hypothetical protein WMY93_006073 [Mugilogobius chulae]|uniref:PB1 domain-containing protein n=1 Tax=Mugilogobius chulae TaxID=88201 RepID=A0AAW0PIM9_9GOBI